MVERSGPHVPRSMSAARCGRRPALAQGRKSCHVAPSSPMTRTFGMGGEKARHSTDGARARQGRWTARWCVPACLALAGVAHADTRPSIVFVLLDTTRADRIGAWGRSDTGTPVLDGLALGGAVFLGHHANSHATRASMPQLLSGRYYHPNILSPFKTHEHPREFDFNRRDPTAVLLPGILRTH